MGCLKYLLVCPQNLDFEEKLSDYKLKWTLIKKRKSGVFFNWLVEIIKKDNKKGV